MLLPPTRYTTLAAAALVLPLLGQAPTATKYRIDQSLSQEMDATPALTFAALDGLAFAAARNRLGALPAGTVYAGCALGPFLELSQLAKVGSLPRPGETGSDTWKGDDWKNRSGTNVWGLFTLDAERGILYMPFGEPTSDYWGGDRPGKNLFGTSLVAVDALTGKLKPDTARKDVVERDKATGAEGPDAQFARPGRLSGSAGTCRSCWRWPARTIRAQACCTQTGGSPSARACRPSRTRHRRSRRRSGSVEASRVRCGAGTVSPLQHEYGGLIDIFSCRPRRTASAAPS
jgi:hypothetical protein